MPYEFQIADENSQSIEVVLDQIPFFVTLDWNESGQYWTMAIRNVAYVTLCDGIAVSANYPLTWQFRYMDMPPGELQVRSAKFRNGPVPRDGFTSGSYHLIYYTMQDLIDAGAWDQYRNVAIAV